MTRSLIAVDDLLVHQCVDDRYGLLVRGHRGFLVLARDCRRDAANSRTHLGAQCYVAHSMLLGLASSFFSGLGIGHEISVSSRPPVAGGGSLLIRPPNINTWRHRGRTVVEGAFSARETFGPALHINWEA